jgi:hypothetical protein
MVRDALVLRLAGALLGVLFMGAAAEPLSVVYGPITLEWHRSNDPNENGGYYVAGEDLAILIRPGSELAGKMPNFENKKVIFRMTVFAEPAK